ncbi:glutaminase A [uncultured Adlercreutzia sp.]|uniref:glutaminase A n=1 Tax=uncultured Adlercreutzia sp. TaxID=875803 RepID=UPI0026760CF0|nr:glutaminase A [uncultured Adlercreutzia sp.]
MVTTLSFDQISSAVRDAYNACKGVTGGQNAHYIPYLANIDSNLFGISLCLPDGRIVSVGDTDYRLGIESVSKVHTAILAMEQAGTKTVLNDIGADATGLPFNSIFAILLENDRPSTPLVNAGAIAACSLVDPHGDAEGKWKAIFDNMTALLGSEPVLIDELYRSESATNFENRSIAWLLREYDRLYDDPTMALDLYTRQCSLGVTAEQLAVSAATIAADGVNPVTKKRVFDASISPKIVALMSSVGFYEHSGDWLYTTGLPAKTGVGGAVIGVMPGLFGVCAFAPPLDDAGNSVKAQAALKHLMNSLNLNVFSNTHFDIASA